MSIQERFWKYVQRTETCWLWTGNGHARYGYIWVNGRNMGAHRLSWWLHYGPIPARMYVLHRCDNPPCVNPSHLFLGSPHDNVIDMWEKSRAPRGTKRAHAKLTDNDVREIRRRLAMGEGRVSLGREFNVTNTAIRHIATGRNWSHVV